MTDMVENINLNVVRQCREQIGLSLDAAARMHGFARAVEEGRKKPTFPQLDILADMYKVPRWVFASEELPQEYRYSHNPSFRIFSTGTARVADEYRLKAMLVRMEQMRSLLLELRGAESCSPSPFAMPEFDMSGAPGAAAALLRSWLGVDKPVLTFSEWRAKVEAKDVFVFMTGGSRQWSYLEAAVHGLAVHHAALPIIIINGQDYQTTQVFTLFHELGRLAHRKSEECAGSTADSEEEKIWCDEFSACVLMPEGQFAAEAVSKKGWKPFLSLDDVRDLADLFRVSPLACLMRLGRLRLITWKAYRKLKSDLARGNRRGSGLREYRPSDYRPGPTEQISYQYGVSFAKSLAEAHADDELNLQKLMNILGLTDKGPVLEMLREFK